MKYVYPNYYGQFKCIADKCKHSCCIGWEIDVDDETFDLYKEVDGDFGARILSEIENSNDGTRHFRLGECERCPFLNERNLCDIILNLGEESLCDICTEHPRFTNEYYGVIEKGLGLCCEETARIILFFDEPFALEVYEDDSDEDITAEERNETTGFWRTRLEILEHASSRKISSEQKIRWFADNFGAVVKSPPETSDLLLRCEFLEQDWPQITSDYAAHLKSAPSRMTLNFEGEAYKVFSNLLCTFIYRYSPTVTEGRSWKNVLSFALTAAVYITDLGVYLNDYVEAARRFSSEIEYSDVNIETFLNFMPN